MVSSFVGSQEELALVSQIFLRAGRQLSDVITGDAAVDIFATKVGLPPDVLSTIWNLADEEKTGNLTQKGVGIAVRLIGWAQKGAEVTPDLVNTPGPFPKIEGITDMKIRIEEHSPQTQLPQFTHVDRDNFYNIFMACGPVNGLLNGDKARDCFLKSSLSHHHLWEIWNLADTHRRGALDKYDFALGMYLIQAFESGYLRMIPNAVPAEVFEQIAGAVSSGPSSGSRITPSNSSVTELSAVPQSSGTLATRKSLPRLPRPLPEDASLAWDVTPAEKFDADKRFDILDPQHNGVVEGDVAAKYMLRFQLPAEDLAHIWDLADLNNDNRLTRDGFAIAIHLIQWKLSGGDLPHVLPASLTPPSMRNGSSVSPQPSHDTSQSYLASMLPSAGGRKNQRQPLRLTRSVPDSAGFSNRSYRPDSIVPDDVDIPPALPPKPDLYEQSVHENSILRSKVEALVGQLKSQDDIRTRNNVLIQENKDLLAKIQEIEQVTSQLLNERNSTVADFSQQNKWLSHRTADLEHAKSQVAQLQKHLGIATQENHHLTLRIREMQDAAEALSVRTMNEVEDFRKQLESLEQDNDHLRSRALEMEQSITQSHTAHSGTDIRALRILMGDVTRENEDLKKRLREMERSTTQLLLSNNDRAFMDDLQRENQRLKLQIMETEELITQLQSSSEDSELRRMLEDVTHENEDLKGQLHELHRAAAQNRSSASVEDLQAEIERLKGDIHRLNVEIEAGSSLQQEVPPPAYEDAQIPDP